MRLVKEIPRPIMLYVENGMFMGKEMFFCKDCKYWNPPEEYKGHVYLGTCARDEQAYLEDCAIQMDADDFCSRGEKR